MKPAPVQPAELTAEDAALVAELHSIEAPAAAIAPGQGAPGPVPDGRDYRADVLDVINFALALFVPMFPSLALVWGDDTRARLADVWAPVFRKYGWDLSRFPELLALAATAPVALLSYRAIRADIDRLRAEQSATESAAPAASAPAPDASGAAG